MWENCDDWEYHLKIPQGKLCVYLCSSGNDVIYLKTGGLVQCYLQYDLKTDMVAGNVKDRVFHDYEHSILNINNLQKEELERLKNIFSLLKLLHTSNV